MALGVQFTDAAVGAVAGAFLAGIFAVILDQRRRKWDEKKRWQNDKRRVYTVFIQATTSLFGSMMSNASFGIAIQKLEEGNVDSKLLDQITRYVEESKRLPSIQDMVGGELVEMTLLGTPEIREAAARVMGVLRQAMNLLDAEADEKAIKLRDEFDEAVGRFRRCARRDLGLQV
jgi:hypothetical protein